MQPRSSSKHMPALLILRILLLMMTDSPPWFAKARTSWTLMLQETSYR